MTLRIQVVPHLLGAGSRSFAAAPLGLDRTRVTHGLAVTHLRYRVMR